MVQSNASAVAFALGSNEPSARLLIG